MSTRTRLARIERAAAARPDVGLVRHWERVAADREAGLLRVLDALPGAYGDRVIDALGGPRGIADVYLVRGPSWLPDDAPAVARWVHQRATWGTDHPFNPPVPIPAALLDPLFAHPDAALNSNRCPGCATGVPSTKPERGSDGHWTPSHPLTGSCPVCGASVAPPRRC